MKTINAQVTDTNHRTRGEMRIQVDFDKTGPSLVEHDGQTYCYTRPDWKYARWPPSTTHAFGSPWTAHRSGKTESRPAENHYQAANLQPNHQPT